MSEKIWQRSSNRERKDETPQAKLRNHLSPFWNLIAILSEKDIVEILSQPALKKIIDDSIEICRKNQQDILNLIQETEKWKDNL